MAKESHPNEDMEFFGAVVTAMSSQAAATSAQLDEVRLQQIGGWKKRFATLYRSMEEVAERTDSKAAHDALDRFSFDMHAALLDESEEEV